MNHAVIIHERFLNGSSLSYDKWIKQEGFDEIWAICNTIDSAAEAYKNFKGVKHTIICKDGDLAYTLERLFNDLRNANYNLTFAQNNLSDEEKDVCEYYNVKVISP